MSNQGIIDALNMELDRVRNERDELEKKLKEITEEKDRAVSKWITHFQRAENLAKAWEDEKNRRIQYHSQLRREIENQGILIHIKNFDHTSQFDPNFMEYADGAYSNKRELLDFDSLIYSITKWIQDASYGKGAWVPFGIFKCLGEAWFKIEYEDEENDSDPLWLIQVDFKGNEITRWNVNTGERFNST